MQQRGDARCARHKDSIKHIVGGHGAGAAFCARPGLEGGEQRHGEQAAGERQAKHVDGDAQALGAFKEVPDRRRGGALRQRRDAGGGEAKVNQERRHAERRQRHGQQENAAMADDGGEDRAEPDADGENGVDGGFDLDAGAKPRFQQHGHKRQRHRAGEPEPAHAERAGPLFFVGAQLAHEAERRGDDVRVDLEARRGDARRGDEAACRPAGQRHRHQLRHDAGRAAPAARRIAAGDDAEQDGEEGRAFDERVAGRQFAGFQLVGENAVFDRAKQRGDDAKAEQGGVEQRQRICRPRVGQGAAPEAGGGDHLDENLGEFQAPGYQRLVIGVGNLAAGRGEENRGQDEQPKRDGDQRPGLFLAQLEQDDHRQHVADEIVIEGREKLGPEQRGETAGAHEADKHLTLQAFK